MHTNHSLREQVCELSIITKPAGMEAPSTQVVFFQHIKSQLPTHISLVDAVADLLDISIDSAYRRIRGEKPVSFEEMQKLAGHFKISIDQFLHIETDSFLFNGTLTSSDEPSFENWLQNVLRQVNFMNSFADRHMYYLAKDLPVMQQFVLPELLTFKAFFWKKSILHFDSMRGAKFSLKNGNPALLEVGKKIVDAYNRLPSTEIWNVESINSTIRQIEFYRESNVFEDADDINVLYQAVFTLIDHIEKQAELGLKFELHGSPSANAASYDLFNNEVILGDNTILARLDSQVITFLNHSVINFVGTRDLRFNNYMHECVKNLIRKSTQLSKVGEKERARFFNRIRDKMKLAAQL